MNFKLFVLLAVAMFYLAMSVSASPVNLEEAQDIEGAVEHGAREKRATCDLFSAFNVQDSLCAANCVRQGFRGGYCSAKKVCRCRR